MLYYNKIILYSGGENYDRSKEYIQFSKRL